MANLTLPVLDINNLFNPSCISSHSHSQFKGAGHFFPRLRHTHRATSTITRKNILITKHNSRSSWRCGNSNAGAIMSFQYEDEDEDEDEDVIIGDRSTRRRFNNRFLNLVKLGSVINQSAESFFKSEIRRRLFVTCALLVVSRLGYFIPLPGFDRRLIPLDYLSFVSGAAGAGAGAGADELADYAPELKMSYFQLGISPQIAASILMQILCHVVPSLVKLRKEGLDGNEKIKSYIWWISLGFAILEALIVACHSLQYSIYASNYRVKHVMVTSFLLVCGAMTMTWICDKISEAGFAIDDDDDFDY